MLATYQEVQLFIYVCLFLKIITNFDKFNAILKASDVASYHYLSFWFLLKAIVTP